MVNILIVLIYPRSPASRICAAEARICVGRTIVPGKIPLCSL